MPNVMHNAALDGICACSMLHGANVVHFAQEKCSIWHLCMHGLSGANVVHIVQGEPNDHSVMHTVLLGAPCG